MSLKLFQKMFLLSRAVKNASFRLRYKTTQLSMLSHLDYGIGREQTCNMQKLVQLESLLTTHRKENMVRNSFNVLETVQILASEARRTEKVVNIEISSCRVSV